MSTFILMITSVNAADEEAYSIVIRFGSVCCGIDLQSREQISRILAETRDEYGLSFETRMVPWGEEGEFNMCLRLNSLPAAGQKKLINRLQEAVRDPQLVKVEEDAPCKEGW